MKNDAAHKEWWQIFEVVFGIPFFAGVVMQWIVPFSLPRGSATLLFITIGIAFLIPGTILVTMARREFRRYDQPTDPGYPTHNIVTTGVFSVSRNPLYLGGICILIGLAFALNLPWVIVLLLPTLVACQYILIAPEEQYLTEKFGEEYRSYTEKVYRWMGQKR
jgi:protein-S-isoprenylcysteine O-methyltransferase Ste14